MKSFLTFLFFAISGVGLCQSDITSVVSEALKKGDAAAIAGFMLPQVELTMEDEDNNLSKEAAQKTLSAFFSQHSPSAFVIKHQGTSKLDDQYRIGELTTAKGNFRITFFMKKTGTTMQIKQFKIETILD